MSAENLNRQPQPGSDEVEAELYRKRAKIYPRQVHGIFAFFRTLAMLGLLGIFYGLDIFHRRLSFQKTC